MDVDRPTDAPGQHPHVAAGVHTITITGAAPGTPLRIVDDEGADRVTLIADESGNAHLAFVPRHHTVLDGPAAIIDALATGDTLQPGSYRIFDDRSDPPAELGEVRVLSVDDLPDPGLYDQELAEGYGYLTVRDGVRLSAMVRFPDPGLYGPPPYPTVIEYSGYSPSDPDEPQPSTLLANLMGFAVVGVNMRGSGCSGGVFDEFLSFHVARRVPRVPELIRTFAPLQFAEVFGFSTDLEADRFEHHDDDLDAALAEYLAEPAVRILFENGAGHEVAGATAHRFEVEVASFPPPGITPRRWWFDDGGRLVDDAPTVAGADRYLDDPDAGELAYSSELLSDLNRFTMPQVPITWTRFTDEHRVAYQTEPLEEPLVISGVGHVELWLAPGTEDTGVQVTLTEIRPDGNEQRVQSGWHRPVHRIEDPAHSDELRVDYTFTEDDRAPLVPGDWIRFRVPIAPVTHLFRAGTRLRIAVSTPGRDHPFWCFDNPVRPGAAHLVGRGGEHPSSMVLPVWPVHLAHDAEHPDPAAHRGQPCRPAGPIHNTSATPA